MAETFDVIVIGGGPGGYVCALRASQLGLKAACVEGRGALGGTCTNVGCIPSKALLQSSHLVDEANHAFAAHGINVGKVEVDLAKMMARKDDVVKQNTTGIEFLLKKNKVAYLRGWGRVAKAQSGAHEVAVKDDKGNETTYVTKYVVIASGSDVTPLPGVTIDEKQIVSSTGALVLSKIPKTMVVIGAGVIGLEMGSVWRRLGTDVTVVEFLDVILPPMDGEVRKQMQRILEKQGMKFRLGHKVTAAKPGKDGVEVTLEPAKGGGNPEKLNADVVLVAIGRRPYIAGAGLDQVGVKVSNRGFVEADENYQTNVEGIFAIGDVIGGMMLAHKAEDEGVACAEILAGHPGHINYDAIASVVYTWPEVAGIGKTEEQLKDAGVAYKVGKFPFTANGRARANGDTDGFAKILADAGTDRVLGCHIVGPAAGDLIMEVAVAMEFGASSEDIARTCHAHPQLGETVKEAALAADKRALHI